MPFLDQDIVVVRVGSGKRVSPFLWGEEILEPKIRSSRSTFRTLEGELCEVDGRIEVRDEPLLKVSVIDVHHGDATLIETPEGQRLLVDAGEGKEVARYLATRHSKSQSLSSSLNFDAVVITHGDADHYAGLPILVHADQEKQKPLFVTADRLFHPGIFKRAGRTGLARLGTVHVVGNRKLIGDLRDDPRTLHADLRTATMTRLIDSVDVLEQRQRRRRRKFQVERLDATSTDPFAFLGPSTRIELIGPYPERVRGKPALAAIKGEGGYTEGHTINGQGLVFRLVHDRLRFLFAADLNAHASSEMVARVANRDAFRSEVLKVPHHGSADFNDEFLRAVSPVVSVVSTGATDKRRDYLHPRASLIAALGAVARPRDSALRQGALPLVFVTQMAGFRQYRGKAVSVDVAPDGSFRPVPGGKPFYALERSAYGIVHLRSDGRRLLVVRYGAGRDKQEPYAFEVDAQGRVHQSKIRKCGTRTA